MTTTFSPEEIAAAVPQLSPTAALELKAILFERRCAQQQVMINELAPMRVVEDLDDSPTEGNDDGST